MRDKIFYTLIMILAFSNCKDQISSSSTSSVFKKSMIEQSQVTALPYLDTTIALADIKDIDSDNRNLTEKEAEGFLYKYFRIKGVLNRSDFKVNALNDAERICVDYDTIYKIQTNKFSGAVISYWLGPCDLNGHCFQPTKAIIIATKNGYKISNEEFIPTNFAIDSTVKSNIYGYDYECGRRGVIRHFKVTLRD